ncbi:MAG TPA: hypothetical protein VGG28_15980 [Kofleriaceae bacterium]
MSSSSRVELDKLGEAIAQLLDHSQHPIVLFDPLRRREPERFSDERDVDLEAHRSRPGCAALAGVSIRRGDCGCHVIAAG